MGSSAPSHAIRRPHKFSSNWQNEVGKRDVKDKDEDLTREPEMIKAYRDTWGAGLDGYAEWTYGMATHLRELLAETGSLYIHIDPGV